MMMIGSFGALSTETIWKWDLIGKNTEKPGIKDDDDGDDYDDVDYDQPVYPCIQYL